MMRGRGRLVCGIALTVVVTAGSAATQTQCRGYKARVIFGDVCLWGCGPEVDCNCVRGACADGTVVVL